MIETETIVYRSVTGTVRRIHGEHRELEKFRLDFAGPAHSVAPGVRPVRFALISSGPRRIAPAGARAFGRRPWPDGEVHALQERRRPTRWRGGGSARLSGDFIGSHDAFLRVRLHGPRGCAVHARPRNLTWPTS